MIQLDSPIADLKGFGPKSAEKFTKLDLHTVGDLLLYFPFDMKILRVSPSLN